MDFEVEMTEVDSPPPHLSPSHSHPDESSNSWQVYEESCVICNDKCYSRPFSSTPNPAIALWGLEIRKVLYEAFSIQVDPSFFHELQGQLPLCPRCSFNVGSLKNIQQRLMLLQADYDRIKDDMALSVMEVVLASRSLKSKQENEAFESIQNKSPSALLNAFRSSEVDALQQLIFEGWNDRCSSNRDIDDAPFPSASYASSPSCELKPKVPPKDRAKTMIKTPPHLAREQSPEKFNYQMPPRRGAPKQYRNKKLNPTGQRKNESNAKDFGDMSTTNEKNKKMATNVLSIPPVILPSTTIDLIPTNLQVTADHEEDEIQRLRLEDADPDPLIPAAILFSHSHSHTFQTLNAIRTSTRIRERLSTKEILSKTLTPSSISPQLFRQNRMAASALYSDSVADNGVVFEEGIVDEGFDKEETGDAFSSHLEITESDLAQYSDGEEEGQKEVGDESEEEVDDDDRTSVTGDVLSDLEEEEEEEMEKKEKPKRRSRSTARKRSSDMMGDSNLYQNDEGLFVCRFCTKTFIHKYPYRDHLKTHTGEGPKCHLCLKIFPKSHNLMLHMRTHTGEKPYKCGVCPKGFADKSNLKVHMRVHTGERPYKCEYCDLTFVNSSRLVVHRRLHTGERPFSCGICDRKFITSNQLASHTKNHFNGKPFKCFECGKGYASTISLQSHSKSCQESSVSASLLVTSPLSSTAKYTQPN